jgi:hypothetical protein
VVTHGGDVTADLRDILERHCPDIADEVVEAYRVARSAVDGIVLPDGGTVPGGVADGDPTGPRWSNFTLGQIPGVQEALTVATTPLEAVAAVLKVVAGILDAVAVFLLDLPDPIRAMLLAAYKILKAFVDDLLSTGAYVYSDVPGVTSWKATLEKLGAAAAAPASWKAGDTVAPRRAVGAFEAWAATFRASFDDPGDGNRPIFSDGATVEAVFVVATAPKMVDLVPLLNMLGTLVDDRKLRDAVKEFGTHDYPGFEKWLHPDPDDWRVRGHSTAPDWKSWKLRDIGPPDYPLRELERAPALLKTILANLDSVVGLLKNLVNVIRAKIQLLVEIADLLTRIVEMIKSLTATGLHVLAVATHDGVDGLVQGFLDAADRPGRNPDGTEVPGLCIGGVCLLAGTSTGLYAAGPGLIWQLFGVSGPLDDAKAALQADVRKARDQLAAAGRPVEQSWDRMKESMRTAGKTYQEEHDRISAEHDEALAGLRDLSVDGDDVLDALAGARHEVLRQVETLAGAGAPLDPLVLSELEAYRTARGRGHRSLAETRRPGP